MADVKKNVIVNHSMDKMFNLVDRIEDYPLFLPWCGGSKILERNKEITKASIHIKYSGVNQSFTTQNTKEYPNRIDLKFSDSPMAIDVIFDGIHCASNVSHPFKEMKKFSPIFWMIAIFGLLASAFELAVNLDYTLAFNIVLIIDTPIVLAYFVSAIFVGKTKPWAFWLGFITYAIVFLISILGFVLSLNSFLFVINIIIRLTFLIFMIRMIKTVLNVSKHKNYINHTGEDLDLLDN